MSFSISPSVTVKEVDLTTVIPASMTPPAAIAGVFRWGPINERVLISSENELVNIFGEPSDLNAETFFTAADFLAYSSALYVVRVDNTAIVATSSNFDAKFAGAMGNSIGISHVSTPVNGDTSEFETALFDTATPTDIQIDFNSNTLVVEIVEDLELILSVGDVLAIGSDTLGYQNLVVDVISSTEVIDGGSSVITYTYDIKFKSNYTLPVIIADAADAVTAGFKFMRKWAHYGVVQGAPAPDTIHLVVVDVDGKISGVPGMLLEKYENVSMTLGAKLPDGTNNYYKDVLAKSSSWIVANSMLSPAPGTSEYAKLTTGADGDSETAVSLGKLAQGYDLYKEANDVDVAFILQGKAKSTNLANYIVSNITDHRRDCVAFISPVRDAVVGVPNAQTQMNNVIEFRNGLQSSSYWMMDSGYKYRYDKYNDTYRWIPLNGDVAGLASRVSPWESPAGYRKGMIRNIIKLAFNPNKTQRDQLYGRDVNPVMTQVGQGTILFGDKTGLGTATGSAFTRINVRRLFITVEKAIATVSAGFLFEFNDEFTQTQFRNMVEPYLRDIQGKRGIIDFRVVSDGTINTPNVIDQNIFRANIFIKPARSINFIELTFIATRTGVAFEELVGLQF